MSVTLWPSRVPFQPKPHRIVQIACEVATKHGVTVQDMRSQSRKMHLVRARNEAYARIYELRGEGNNTPFSLPAIGRYFGDRDHTTVLHGMRRHRELVCAPFTSAEG
jgi:chromosomal replication initiator protein